MDILRFELILSPGSLEDLRAAQASLDLVAKIVAFRKLDPEQAG